MEKKNILLIASTLMLIIACASRPQLLPGAESVKVENNDQDTTLRLHKACKSVAVETLPVGDDLALKNMAVSKNATAFQILNVSQTSESTTSRSGNYQVTTTRNAFEFDIRFWACK
ncbi:MAG: hypothetical protein U1F16_12260 [Turneriella sp.]